MLNVHVSLTHLTFADESIEDPVSILNIKYTISGDRSLGAHSPVAEELSGSDNDNVMPLTFRSALVLQRPVLDPCLAVGFLPLPSSGLRVGQLVTMKWRVERLKDSDKNVPPDDLVRLFSCSSVFHYPTPSPPHPHTPSPKKNKEIHYQTCNYCFSFVQQDEVLYEVNVNSENWMVAGRKRGYASLSTKQGIHHPYHSS